ncbi:MAG: hypothetical protein ACE5HE_05915 [Phycisphaerae bacterium]
MIARSFATLIVHWPGMLTGTTLALVGLGVGWAVGARSSFAPVRAIAWWITAVILPLLATRSWIRRGATIFINNGLIAAAVVALGAWPVVAIAAVAAVGVNLGIALRVLAGRSSGLPEPPEPHGARRAGWRTRLGIALNLLELPAIVVALGLAMDRAALPLSTELVWETFIVWVLPTLLVAAAGEALWLGDYFEMPELRLRG